MPLNKYFHGKGESVMADMRKKYGDEKGERVFYATANAKHMKPAAKSKSRYTRRGEK